MLLFTGRTGSSHLMASLALNPAVCALGEILPDLTPWTAQEQRVSELFGTAAAPILAVGFKTKLIDVASLDGFVQLLVRCQASVLHMVRKNPLKQALSELNARRLHARRRVWNLRAGDPPLEPNHVEVGRLEGMIARIERRESRLRAFVDRLPLRKRTVTYEALFHDERGTLARVCEFLEVPWAACTSDMQKMSPDDLRELPNFAELREHFAGSAYAPLLEERS